VIFGEIADNGKRLCEGGAFTPEISTKNCHKQKPISFAKIQKLVKEIGFLRLKKRKSSTQGTFTPAFAKPMLN